VKLAQLQRALQAHVLHGDGAIAALVPGTARFDTRTRLAVYADGYAPRLAEALAQTYPALRQSLGPAVFAHCVASLARAAPSRHFSVRYYGKDLAAVIERHVRGVRGRAAADLARFEWALAAAFDAADARPIAATDLERIAPRAWPQLRFDTTPSLQSLELRSNAVAFWKAACETGPRPTRWRLARPQRWLIWRRDLGVYFRPLAADEAAALASLRAGGSFRRQCSAIAAVQGDAGAAQRAAALLRGWVEEGLLSGWRLR
jgi:hypothetical protein